MSNEEFSNLVATAFEEQKKEGFLSRVNIVNTEEKDVPKIDCTFISSDVVKGTPETGKFEFTSDSFPKIVTGFKLTTNSEKDLPQIAKNLAMACQHRLNALLALFIYGQGEMGSFYVHTNTPEDVHTVITDYNDVVPAIIEKVNYMQDTYGIKYDRLTLNEALLTMITGELKLTEAKKVLKKDTGLKIDLSKGYYREKSHTDTKSKVVPFVPHNKLIFSNSKTDKSDKFYFANLPVFNQVDSTYQHGITGYFHDNAAFAALRGIPVLNDVYTFSTITIKND